MAWIREHVSSSGAVTWQVHWRVGGRRGRHRSRTVASRRTAELLCAAIDGGAAPPEPSRPESAWKPLDAFLQAKALVVSAGTVDKLRRTLVPFGATRTGCRSTAGPSPRLGPSSQHGEQPRAWGARDAAAVPGIGTDLHPLGPRGPDRLSGLRRGAQGSPDPAPHPGAPRARPSPRAPRGEPRDRPRAADRARRPGRFPPERDRGCARRGRRRPPGRAASARHEDGPRPSRADRAELAEVLERCSPTEGCLAFHGYRSTGGEYKELRRIFAAAGVGYVSWHKLRHTFATILVANGASVTAVRDLLGHSSLATTSKYLHATDEDRRRAVEVMARALRGA